MRVSASYAALGSVFLGSLSMLVYQSGQLPTTAAAALTLNAMPFFYYWLRTGQIRSTVKRQWRLPGRQRQPIT